MVKEKSVHYYIISLLLMIWTTACDSKSSQGGEQANYENEIEFELIEFEEKYYLENKEDYPSCNLSIKILYPVSSNKYELGNIHKQFTSSIIGVDLDGLSLEEAIEKYSKNYIENYRRDANVYRVNRPKVSNESNYYDDVYYEDNEHSNTPDIFYSYFESITDTIAYNSNGILSYQVKQTNNKGGNISHENIRSYVIDLESGELLSEGDIFTAGYDVALRTMIQNGLMSQQDVKSIEDLEDLGYFGIDEIIPNNNFLLTSEGIIYTYNKGEYSAYQLSASHILIPYSHIRSILKEGSIADKLSKL